MFVAIFVAFLRLFHLLFIAKISTWSTLFETNRMLFQMSLFKFDVYELSDAASFWGPITFTLFIFVVVFVCMSMFLSIINQSFHLTRILAEDDNHHQIASKIRLLMIENLFRWFSKSSFDIFLIFIFDFDSF